MQPLFALDPIIAIGIAIAWAIIQAISKKKQDAGDWADLEIPRTPAPPPQPAPRRSPPPPVQQKRTPPPVRQPKPVIVTQRPYQPPPIPPVILEQEGPTRVLAHLAESQKAYERAANLQQSVEQRMAAVDRQTSSAKPEGLHHHYKTRAALELLQNFRRPESVRQAFLASFVLNPPKALE